MGQGIIALGILCVCGKETLLKQAFPKQLSKGARFSEEVNVGCSPFHLTGLGGAVWVVWISILFLICWVAENL